MTVITILTLKGMEIDDSISMTGTINSGNLIGQVGGVKDKISAASEVGVKKVLIPFGEVEYEDNVSINFTQHGFLNQVDVIEVKNIDEALFEFTGKRFRNISNESIEIDKEYNEIMKDVSDDLCYRMKNLMDDVKDAEEDLNESIFEEIIKESEELSKEGDYYSAASRCFSTNINLKYRSIDELTIKDYDKLQEEIEMFEKEVSDMKIDTIPEFQTYMIIKERIREANSRFKLSFEVFKENNTLGKYEFAFANERLISAMTWSKFFEMEGKELNLDKDVLKETCITKIKEAAERMQYVNSILPEGMVSYTYIEEAREEYSNEEYALCINYASLAKSSSDVIISGAGASSEDVLKTIVKNKLDVARENIILEQEKGSFPILAYSYLEYSNNLIEDNIYSSLLFSQYALELSNFEIYFNDIEKSKLSLRPLELKKDYELFLVYIFGLITGIVIMYMANVLIKN